MLIANTPWLLTNTHWSWTEFHVPCFFHSITDHGLNSMCHGVFLCAMVLWLHLASRAQTSTTMHITFDLDLELWHWTQTLTFDLQVRWFAQYRSWKLTIMQKGPAWGPISVRLVCFFYYKIPHQNTLFYRLTLTYNPSLARVKVNLHAKNEGQTVCV